MELQQAPEVGACEWMLTYTSLSQNYLENKTEF